VINYFIADCHIFYSRIPVQCDKVHLSLCVPLMLFLFQNMSSLEFEFILLPSLFYSTSYIPYTVFIESCVSGH
jgi:hypothetical protein